MRSQIWQRVTGSWVTVTGKRREDELLICSYDARPAGVILYGAHAVLGFALEAKCYAPTSSVGVRETSRLISRLRYRQFGILVTTSYLDTQAYREIREDGHPVIVLAGVDIVEMLKVRGLDDNSKIRGYLQQTYPPRRVRTIRWSPPLIGYL